MILRKPKQKVFFSTLPVPGMEKRLAITGKFELSTLCDLKFAEDMKGW